MSDGQRYTKAVDLLGFGDPVMSATWKSGPTFMALSDRSLSLKTNYHTAWGQMEKWGNRAPRTEKCCTPSGWSHKKLSCSYSSPNILICHSLLFANSCLTQAGLYSVMPDASENCEYLTSQILNQCIFCFLLLTLNHIVHPEQKQYSPLRAMFKVYSKPSFPSLRVVLSQEPDRCHWSKEKR